MRMTDNDKVDIKLFAEMGKEERQELIHTLSNPAWWDDDDREMEHPAETVSFLATLTGDEHLMRIVPAVRQLEGHLVPVPLDNVRDTLFELYGVDEQTIEKCRRKAEARRRLVEGNEQDNE